MRLLCEEFDEHGRVSWLKTAKPENVRFTWATDSKSLASRPCWRRTSGFCADSLSDCSMSILRSKG